jgi:hypothetical protein
MNVGQLRKLLEQADDSDIVVMKGPDHSFVNTYISYGNLGLEPATGYMQELPPLKPTAGFSVAPCIILESL